jgi:tRNA threonylcarbamoyladenosine biosynthesis protein TsaE
MISQDKYISTNSKETKKIASKLAKHLVGGDLICLYGELGAGKTEFIKGLAESLGVSERVNSPSYSLLNIYKLKEKGFRLAHFDFYRLDNNLSQPPADLKDYIGEKNYLVVIEWAGRVEKFLPDKRIDVKLNYLEKINSRKVEINKKI